MRQFLQSITHRLKLPAICIICKQYHCGQLALCDDCQKLIIPIQHACKHCALPLPEGQFLICGICAKKKPVVDRTFAPYLYEDPLRRLIHTFKYQEGLYLCSFLATLMIRSIPLSALTTECLVPIPLHQKRLQQRGFNQAAELAKYISRHINIPYALTLCSKIKNTIPQAELTASQRVKNIQNAFKAKPLHYRHLTLIDDIITTGSTVNELAKVIKNQGVETVDVWCIARVIRPSAPSSFLLKHE